MNGLASMMAQPTVGQQTRPMRDVSQIAQMLKQGVSPQELVQQGVPAELVQAAMEMVQKEATAVTQEQSGLAAEMLAR